MNLLSSKYVKKLLKYLLKNDVTCKDKIDLFSSYYI